MKPVLFLLIFVVWSSSAFSQSGEAKYEKDLEKLRDRHHADIEAAMEPLRKRYAYQLETLLKRATLDGDLDSAVKIRKELETLQADGNSAFVGEWEYQQNGNTYRRIILKNGTVELWKNGKEWMKSANVPWWDGYRWKLEGNTLQILDKGGKTNWGWTMKGKDEVAQKDSSNGKIWILKRAKDSWK